MSVPRKRFGQHFLCDKEVIADIVRSLDPKPTDHLIEIGPGQGALTTEVLKRTHQLEVIELDRDLIPELQLRTKRWGHLEIMQADVLKVDFEALKQDQRLLRIFGNLPYNISTPLIFHLLQSAAVIADMLFMVQKEVALRLTAKPDTEHYGRLSIMVQYHAAINHLFDVKPHAFYPQPQVHSSIVRLVPFQQVPFVAKDYSLFATLVREAFNLRRKTLRNSLKKWISDDIWQQLDLRSDARPETLSVQAFVELSNAITAAQKDKV